MSNSEFEIKTTEEKNSPLDLPTSGLTIVIFLFMMAITGGMYKLINYKDMHTSLLKELAIVGSSILVSFVIALLIKRIRKGIRK